MLKVECRKFPILNFEQNLIFDLKHSALEIRPNFESWSADELK